MLERRIFFSLSVQLEPEPDQTGFGQNVPAPQNCPLRLRYLHILRHACLFAGYLLVLFILFITGTFILRKRQARET